MKSFFKLTYMELKLQLREPVGLFFTLAFPVMLMALFGAIFGNEADEFLGGVRPGRPFRARLHRHDHRHYRHVGYPDYHVELS